MKPSARFITFEGIDGAGKSSHIEAVAGLLRERGHEVLLTREPGGTPLAEQLRTLFLNLPMDALTEALLVFAGRRDHLQTLIEPALSRGITVLCDRFTDATFAYQGAGRDFDRSVLTQLETWVQRGRQPDITLWFDLPGQVAAARRASAREPDRLEREHPTFFEQVRAGYAARCAAQPERFLRIDADQALDAVGRVVESALLERLDVLDRPAAGTTIPAPSELGDAD